MNTSVDKLMTRFAYIYIITPFLIFCCGWLRWYWAGTMAVVLVLGCLLALKSTTEYKSIDLKKHKKKILMALGAILVLVFFSGIGAYTYQNDDHTIRNAIFRDLVTHSWPFAINEHGSLPFLGRPVLFIYYLNYWLPAALVGKGLGWGAANFFLFLWTFGGVTLAFYFLCRYFGRFSLRLLFIFMFFNGLYLVVSFAKYPLLGVLASDGKIWSGNMILAGSNIDSMYWIYNQAVTPWLIILLIMGNIPKQNIFFLFALCFLHGPFFFLGFAPFLAIMVARHVFGTDVQGTSLSQKLLSYLSFQNTAGVVLILAVSVLYLSGSNNVQPLYFDHVNKFKYLIFIFVSFGAIMLLIANKYKKDPFFYTILAMLLVLPLIGMGQLQSFTFCARVSLAPMFVLMTMVARYYFEEGKSWLRSLVVVYLVLGSIEPALEVGRSVVFTAAYYANRAATNRYLYNRAGPYSMRQILTPKPIDWAHQNFLIEDDLKSVDNAAYSFNKYAVTQNDSSFFNRYLLRRKQ